MSTVQESHAKARVYVNGIGELLRQANVQISVKTNNTPQYSLPLGRSGFTKGAIETEITVTSGIPGKDFEMDALALINKGDPVEVTIFMANRTLTCSGAIENASWNSAVNSNAETSFTISGGESIWTSLL